MKFAVANWPAGQFLIDNGYIRVVNQGTIDDYIDTTLPQWQFLLSSALAGGRPPPIDAIPLDEATHTKMVLAYGPTRVARVVP